MTSWCRYAVVGVLAAAAPVLHADAEGRKLFNTVVPACALCHVLRDAGAAGEVGPSLDELKPDHDRVVKALRNGIGQMPAFTHLSEAEIGLLARYIEQATK